MLIKINMTAAVLQYPSPYQWPRFGPGVSIERSIELAFTNPVLGLLWLKPGPDPIKNSSVELYCTLELTNEI